MLEIAFFQISCALDKTRIDAPIAPLVLSLDLQDMLLLGHEKATLLYHIVNETRSYKN